jgi:hypothetical protein
MNIITSWKVKITLLAGVVIGILLVGAIGVAGQPRPPEPRAPGKVRTDSGLLVPNRDRLSICVQASSGIASMQRDVRARIEQLLPAVEQHPNWSRARYNQVPRSVVAGCPGDAHLLRPGIEYIDGRPGPSSAGERPLQVEQASPHRLFVYILPQAELARIIRGQLNIRIAPQETVCEGFACAQVSTGLYVSPEELHNDAFMRDWLAKGLGLEPPVSLDTPPNAPRRSPGPSPAPSSPTPRPTP